MDGKIELARRLHLLLDGVASCQLGELAYGASATGCDLVQQIEKGPLPRRADAPVDRWTLVAVAIVVGAWIEIPPRRVAADRLGHVIDGTLEVEVVVFVEDDGHGPVADDRPRLVDHRRDASGFRDAVAMEQQKVGCADDAGCWDAIAPETGNHEKATTLTAHLANKSYQFVNTRRLENGMVVALNVALVADFHKHVGVATG